MFNDPATDRASLVALQQGDTTALNRLINRWQQPLISYAYRYVQNSADAHDLVASLFVRFYQQRDRLLPNTNVSAWLFTALTNLALLRARRGNATLSRTPAFETAVGKLYPRSLELLALCPFI